MKGLAITLAGLAMIGVAQAQGIKIKVENEIVAFDAMPRQVNGVTMVPLRPMVETMGGTMKWDLARRAATVWKSGRRFDMIVNSLQTTSSDKMVKMEEAPAIFQNRLYVPLKDLADAAGYVISMEDGWYVLRSTQIKTSLGK